MKRNSLKGLLLLVGIALTLSACKTRKLVVVAPPAVKTDTVKIRKVENLNLLKSKNMAFKTLSLKGKAQLNINGDDNNVTVNIRMLKDKKIWMSVTAIAGIEVARVLISPDSLLVLSRLQGVYLQKPFSYIHNFANKEVDFKLLQELLTGNASPDFLVEDAALSWQNGVWNLKATKNKLGFQILFNTLLKAAETNLNDVQAAQAVKVVYGNYQKVENYLFPSGIQLNALSGMKKVSIALDFSKIESNVDLDFPFTVPKRFKVIH